MSSGAKVAIAIVVVVVIVLAALLLGLVPGVHLFGSSSSATSVSSSSSALGPASALAAEHDAGALVLVAGISTTYSFQFGKLSGLTGASCPVTDPLSTNLTVPGENGSYSSGEAPVWLFVYYNATALTQSLIAVLGSTAYFLGALSGASCVDRTLASLPATFLSSTSAASVADENAGSFLSAHPAANAIDLLLENNTTKTPEWFFVYTNCSYDFSTNQTLGGTKADLFAGEVNGATGSLIHAISEPGFANCSAGFPAAAVTEGPAALASLAVVGPAGVRAASPLPAPREEAARPW